MHYCQKSPSITFWLVHCTFSPRWGQLIVEREGSVVHAYDTWHTVCEVFWPCKHSLEVKLLTEHSFFVFSVFFVVCVMWYGHYCRMHFSSWQTVGKDINGLVHDQVFTHVDSYLTHVQGKVCFCASTRPSQGFTIYFAHANHSGFVGAERVCLMVWLYSTYFA